MTVLLVFFDAVPRTRVFLKVTPLGLSLHFLLFSSFFLKYSAQCLPPSNGGIYIGERKKATWNGQQFCVRRPWTTAANFSLFNAANRRARRQYTNSDMLKFSPANTVDLSRSFCGIIPTKLCSHPREPYCFRMNFISISESTHANFGAVGLNVLIVFFFAIRGWKRCESYFGTVI